MGKERPVNLCAAMVGHVLFHLLILQPKTSFESQRVILLDCFCARQITFASLSSGRTSNFTSADLCLLSRVTRVAHSYFLMFPY
jgi:hypothetical protein